MRSVCRLLALALLLLAGPALADRGFLVDADWLAAKIDDPKTVVLEVRYHPHRYYTVGHIPGAVQVQRFKDLGDNAGRSIMLFPDKDSFQATLRRWGVNDDSTIVLYDDSRSALAARAYYLLALYGFDMSRVKVLDGGTQEWMAFNELSKDPVTRQPGNVTLKPAEPEAGGRVDRGVRRRGVAARSQGRAGRRPAARHVHGRGGAPRRAGRATSPARSTSSASTVPTGRARSGCRRTGWPSSTRRYRRTRPSTCTATTASA